MTEDEIAGWHHRLDVPELEQAAGVGNGQGGLVCCSSWGRQESDMTEPSLFNLNFSLGSTGNRCIS